VRRRRQAGLVADASARVEADRSRSEVCLEVAGEVAGGAVVACDDQRRALAVQVQQAREEERSQAGGGENTLWLAGSRVREPAYGGLALCEWK
jgi:hypothetical protein